MRGCGRAPPWAACRSPGWGGTETRRRCRPPPRCPRARVARAAEVAIARGKIRAGLRNADDRLARGEFRKRDTVVEVPLQIERGHCRIFRIVEPCLRAQPAARRLELRIGYVCHCLLLWSGSSPAADL